MSPKKIAEKADSLAVEKAARRARDRVARRTTATTAVGGEEPLQKTGSPVPKPKPRIQRKAKVQAVKGFSAEIEEARKTLTKKGMSDAEKYALIATIGVMGRVLPPLASMTLRGIKTIFKFIRSPKKQSAKALRESVKKLNITKAGLVVDMIDEAGGYDLKKPQKPDMFERNSYNKGGLQMAHGGAYKGKKHSYAAGGKVNKLNF